MISNRPYFAGLELGTNCLGHVLILSTRCGIKDGALYPAEAGAK